MDINADDYEFSVRCIRLADGSLIDPLTREPIVGASPVKRNREQEPAEEIDPIEEIEEETSEEAEAAINAVFEIEAIARRSIHDITIPKNQMALVCMVITYERWGLPDDEIIQAIGCTYDALRHIRNINMYTLISDSLTQSMRNAYMSSVEGVMQQASMKAALKMVKFIGNKSNDIALAASKDILDRSGHRPADKVEVNTRSESSLTIRVIRQADEDKMLNVIDLDAN